VRLRTPAPLVAVLALALLSACGSGGSSRTIIVATTTSIQDSGLLDVLLPAFETQTGIRAKAIAVGSGAAIAMAARGDADAVFVHDPKAEAQAVAAGDLVDGVLVMTNDFLIVGPPDDPAQVRAARDAADAFRRIAVAGVPFVSRGDNSGTHAKELTLWTAVGVDPSTLSGRLESGQGMGATLTIASERRAYTLTDRATYTVLRATLALEPLFQGDAELVNPYHAYVVNPERHRGVRADLARAFVRFLVSPEAQRAIAAFGLERYGEPLFVPADPRAREEPGR
jgi:tungstate transport system substrate-binding protein